MDKTTWVHEFLNSGSLISCAKSDLLLLGWGVPENSQSADSKKYSCYAPDFFLGASPSWFNFPNQKTLSRSELLDALLEVNPKSEQIQWPIAWDEADYPTFKTAFLDLQNQFESGLLTKAVPYIFERAVTQFSSENRAALISGLLKQTTGLSLFLYGMWTEELGMLGASPELLFKFQPGSTLLNTCAVAGTRPVGNERMSLLEDLKELREHRLVIEGITESLSPLGQVSKHETRELQFRHLYHLVTAIDLISDRPIEFEKTVRALHPTPALGAHPKEAGSKWLKFYETRMPRKRFGAPFGVVSELLTEIQCIVAIRNIQWERCSPTQVPVRNEFELVIGAGCGVISESILEREWSEIQTKLQTIKRMFGL